ncbi:Retrovirus-related Pol polyprotein from transposon 297 [Linum grandiflorum]
METEEDDEDYSSEMDWMAEQDERSLEPVYESVEVINLGTEDNRRDVKIGGSLCQAEKDRFTELLRNFQDVFAWSYKDMPGLDEEIVMHRLPIREECRPVRQKLRRMKPEWLLKIKEEVQKQYEAGFLQVSQYPEWVANVVPVPKKSGKVRMCVDYRDLNRASPKDNFPLPHIDVLVDNTANHHMFSFMDGFSGYNQIKMCPEDREKTTFITLWGTFCYKVMSFGLKNAGATYQRAMVTLFHDMIHREIEVYVDDIIAKSKEGEDHVAILRKLFERLRKYQLRLNPEKCTFGVTSGKLLGFIVSQKGIEVDPDKVKAIVDMPPPQSQKEVRGFLGRLNYISRFISHLTPTCEPIFKLLKKNKPVEWDEDCSQAFQKVKECLLNPPVLIPPTAGRPLILYLTVFENSVGAMLAQQDESGKREHAIYYASKKFTDCESRYTPLEKTCGALAWAAKRLRQYMLYHTTMLVSKMDPIKYVFEKPALSGRIARWQVLLAEYDIVYTSRKAVKGSVVADHLAEHAVPDLAPMMIDFPDEHIMSAEESQGDPPLKSWVMKFDGASNSLGQGVGVVFLSPEGKVYPITAKICFDCTNNIAEYEACAFGISAAIKMNIKRLKVYGDSALVIYQLREEWETRDHKLVPYQKYIKGMMAHFESIQFDHISRVDNQIADALATLSSMYELDETETNPRIEIKKQGTPAYLANIEGERDGNPWYHDIRTYLQTRRYPFGASDNDKRTLRRLAMGYYADGSILYKVSHDSMLLRCVDAPEAQKIVEEVHEGVCGTHAGGHALAKKILRLGYYWTTMDSDCVWYVRRCHKCQIYADERHVAPSFLHVMSSPWPFAAWGIDVIGMIEPKASNGHRFILVAIDYFTKWVEAASYVNITKSVVTKFIKKEIICRYGLPERIITDNAKNLNNKMMDELCSRFKIKHHNSVPYRPKMNGAVEAANKNIKKIVQKMVVTYHDWHEMLPFALHGYRTSVRTSTGATPYQLVYGTEAVLPIEVEIPSLRVLMEAGLEEAEWVKTRYDQLNLIDEKRLAAIHHGHLYQSRLIRAFNKKVKPREFREGELVTKKISIRQGDPRGKWTPNYEGPYVVKKAFSGGALILTTMDGSELPYPVNSDTVNKYYA